MAEKVTVGIPGSAGGLANDSRTVCCKQNWDQLARKQRFIILLMGPVVSQWSLSGQSDPSSEFSDPNVSCYTQKYGSTKTTHA